MTHISKSLYDTQHIAEKVIASLRPKENQATIIGLIGNLGAGKTTFTQAAAKTLGITETVTSPTFILEKLYKLENQRFETLIHIDAYRLDGGAELAKLNWAEISGNPKNLILVEWPERVADILPLDIKKISFVFIDEQTRQISVE